MSERELQLIALVWREMNRIRARDGVPRDFQGIKTSVSQEYWDELMSGLNSIMIDRTGKGAWLNPILHKEGVDIEGGESNNGII